MSGTERPSAARFQLPAGMATASAHANGTLSPELEAAAARRLGALAGVVAVVAAILGVTAHVAGAPSFLDPRLRSAGVALDAGVAFALSALIASGRLPPSKALRLGVVFQLAHAFLSAVLFHALTMAPGVTVRGWTPVAVWAVVYPLIVPSRPDRVWITTLATAVMDPLGMFVNAAAGAPVPRGSDLAQLFMPTALVCVLSPIAARIVYGLTVEVKRAREMGSYRLVMKLGQGGMGEVWRAEHRMLARGAAIKLIRPGALGARDGKEAHEIVKRFEREAQATAALRSPHTIAVYDYGVAADGTFHYVMELLEGFSLQALVDRFGPVPPERAVRFLRQACHSLEEAHAAGLVHRDVKPANLIVCRLGLDVDFVKVLDFGLVKLQGPQASGTEALTVAGAFTGTPGFMPPEVALGTEPVDGRADIYALGCVAYWLLTGQRVFDGMSAMQMIIDHVRTPPVPPSQRARQPIPPALEDLVLRCLAKDPAARPSSARELAAALAGLGLEERWTGAARGTGGASTRRPRRRGRPRPSPSRSRWATTRGPRSWARSSRRPRADAARRLAWSVFA
jgi:eukaryotic-like serine/threonine-protein kinase